MLGERPLTMGTDLRACASGVLAEAGAGYGVEVSHICRDRKLSNRLYYTCMVVRGLFGCGLFGEFMGERYMFTGKVWERVEWCDLSDALSGWMLSAGFPTDVMMRRYMDYEYRREFELGAHSNVLAPRCDLMAFRNCVADFSSMTVYGHSPSFHCLRLYDFDFSARARCPLWMEFLGAECRHGSGGRGVVNDADRIASLQRVLGSSLIDRRAVHFGYFLLLQGEGQDGRDTFLDVLCGVLGDGDVLSGVRVGDIGGRGLDALEKSGRMCMRRLLVCTESRSDGYRERSRIREYSDGACAGGACSLSGFGGVRPLAVCVSDYIWGDGEFRRENGVLDAAMMRGAVKVNFRVPDGGGYDSRLRERLLEERAGIFAWMVRGLMALRRDGFRMNRELDSRIELLRGRLAGEVEYMGMKVSGSVAEFVRRKRIVPGRVKGSISVRMDLDDLFASYVDFCELNGADAVPFDAFRREVSCAGVRVSEDRGGRVLRYTASVGFCDGDARRDVLVNRVSIEEEMAGECLL